MRNAIEVKDLSVSYGKNKVLDNVFLDIPLQSRTAIIGANGAGKSTFIKAILGLIKKEKGDVKILGNHIKSTKQNVAYVPQKDSVNWDFPISVYDVVMMGRYPHMKSFAKADKKDYDCVNDALNEMGILDLKNRQISNLSGGQKQRVFLARALAQDAAIYILDEPLTGVDVKTEDIIADEFKKMQEMGKTVIAVHHNIYTLEKYFDNLVVLNKDIKYSGSLYIDNIKDEIDKGFRS